MTKQDEKFSLDKFDDDIHFAIRMLDCDVRKIKCLLEIAREHEPDREIVIRREIRPLAVELLYLVIGDIQAFEDAVNETELREDEYGD